MRRYRLPFMTYWGRMQYPIFNIFKSDSNRRKAWGSLFTLRFQDPTRSPDGLYKMVCSLQGSVVGARGLLSITITPTMPFNPAQVVPTANLRSAGTSNSTYLGLCPKGNFGCQNIQMEIRQIRYVFVRRIDRCPMFLSRGTNIGPRT